MAHYSILEGIAEKLEIAVCLTVKVTDTDIATAFEETGIREADGKAAGIFAQVAEDSAEVTGCGENLVVEAFFEYVVKTAPVVDRHLEGGELPAEDFIEWTFHRQENMHMIRHEGVLQYAQRRMNGGDVAEAILDRSAERRGLDIRAAGGTRGDASVADQRAEARDAGSFEQGDMIDLTRAVIMPWRPAVAGPVSAHKRIKRKAC